MRASGKWDLWRGGGDGVIAAILSALGDKGTMIMVLGSPEEGPFDAHTSPADPEMGTLAELFRKYPGTVVNDHPAARFCGIGPMTETLLPDPPLHDYYGHGSVLERFLKANGRILRLGADLDTVTLLHHAEYLANVSPKRRVRRRYDLAESGTQWIESLDDCEGIQDWPAGDYFSQILIDFLKTEPVQTGQVGNCSAELIEAQNIVPFAVTWMENHLQTGSSS